jgi:hypothetical protein
MDSDGEFSFQQWKTGDVLPEYADHVTGVTLVEEPHSVRTNTPEAPLDWP